MLRPMYSGLAFALSVMFLAHPALAGDKPKRQKRPSFEFALIGDVPYTEEQVQKFDTLIQDVNAHKNLRFVLHAGDIKGGSVACDDATFLARLGQYQQFAFPFIYTPGDNEWTDCHRIGAGQFDPIERLQRLRQLFFPQPGKTLIGQTKDVETQSTRPGFEQYVENVLWMEEQVVFSTIHVVGSNNNLAPWSGIDPNDSFANPRADRLAEFEARQAAALAWLDETFQLAQDKNSLGVFILIHANPLFETSPAEQDRAGFNAFLDLLQQKVIEFGRPVVLAHGDFHFFVVDKPLFGPTAGGSQSRLEDFTRVQTFGTDDVHWIRVGVYDEDPKVFRVEQVIVEENRFER